MAFFGLIPVACDGAPAGAGASDAASTTDATDTTRPGDTAGPSAETAGATVALTFAVTVPDETPLGATVVVTREDGAPIALTQDADGTYRGAGVAPAGSLLSWQVALTAPVAAVEAGTGGRGGPRTLQLGASAQSVSGAVDHWTLGGSGSDVAFVVTVPAETPADAHVWLSGNDAVLGAWNGAGLELVHAQRGHWGKLVQVAAGTALELKATRGSWDTVEKAADGSELQNRAVTISSAFDRIAFTVAAWRDLVPTPPAQLGASRIDYIRGVGSTHLASARDVIVYLPPGYDDDASRRYPVLYMHDGQNLMDASTSAFGEWGVDEAADDGIRAGEIEPVIIVGVYNTGDRMSEYTQAYDSSEGTGGKADDYGKFLVSELKPRIDQSYRTKTDQASTGVAGSSLGGLVSMYFGLTLSDTFGRIGAVSPSVWWADRDILARVGALAGKLPIRVWVDIGTSEPGSAVSGARALRDALVAKGWVLGQDLAYGEFPGAHDEGAWSARIGDILRWLYPAR